MSIFARRRSPSSMKRFYNRIFRYYSSVEKILYPVYDAIVEQKIAVIDDITRTSALDYACGAGALTLKLARHFDAVEGRDQSEAMLDMGRRKAENEGVSVQFREGNLLAIDEGNETVDWVFIGFALHLFPPETGIGILKKLLDVSRAGVIIIDHSRKWSMKDAFIEWLEGSYYDKFIKMDFQKAAEQIGAASFEETEIERAMVLTFGKNLTIRV